VPAQKFSDLCDATVKLARTVSPSAQSVLTFYTKFPAKLDSIRYQPNVDNDLWRELETPA